jgi:four helix bundle suffix protein
MTELIPKHGGYRRLKSFQIGQLIYDLTVRFCELYIDRKSRTRDQMVQAARSGVQNIAEGSQASGTSKKSELKLTNVARASLEELRLDYEDFLRQRGLPQWEPEHPALLRFKARRCASVEAVRAWVGEEKIKENTDGKAKNTDLHGQTRTNTDLGAAGPSVAVRGGPCQSVLAVSPCASRAAVSPCKPLPASALVANAVLSLLNLCCHLLDRQIAAQAKAFTEEGGFTERLYRTRSSQRKKNG